MKLRGRIQALAVAALTVGVLGGSTLSAGVAGAATEHGVATGKASMFSRNSPDAVYYCEGNICARKSGGTTDNPDIDVYADEYNFYGHYQLKTPNGKGINSGANKSWGTGTANIYTFSNTNGGSGCYTAIAWESVGDGDYDNIGQVCIDA